jgi:anti-sigma B factor antagonist
MAPRQTAPAELDCLPTASGIARVRAIAGGRPDPAVEQHSRGLSIVERDSDGIRMLDVAGELDLATAVELCARVDAARGAGQRRLLVDLTQLEFCDSSGLRALFGAAEEVLASAGRVVLVPPADGAVARLFALIGADELLPLRPSAAEALATLETTPRT